MHLKVVSWDLTVIADPTRDEGRIVYTLARLGNMLNLADDSGHASPYGQAAIIRGRLVAWQTYEQLKPRSVA